MTSFSVSSAALGGICPPLQSASSISALYSALVTSDPRFHQIIQLFYLWPPFLILECTFPFMYTASCHYLHTTLDHFILLDLILVLS